MELQNNTSTICNLFNPDNIYSRFKVVEFPTSFVGLWTKLELDVEENLNTAAYLKTMYHGRFMKFEDAREISPSHRAYTIEQKSESILQITFQPNNECISRAKLHKQVDNRFIFDLRLIKIDLVPCCDNEHHCEAGRFYISGQFEYCEIKHSPKIIKFGDVIIDTKVKRSLRIRNESEFITAKFRYIRLTGFEIVPDKFSIPPNSSKNLCVTIKPTSLKVGNTILFKIRNYHDMTDDGIYEDKDTTDDNYLTYTVKTESNIIYSKRPKTVIIQSLHLLHEKDAKHTYVDEELTLHLSRKDKAREFLKISKSLHAKPLVMEKFTTGRVECYSVMQKIPPKKNFCQKSIHDITTFDVKNIAFSPFLTDFGSVCLHSYADKEVIIRNNTNLDITIKFLKDTCVLFSENKDTNKKVKLKSLTEIKLIISCWGNIEGNYKRSFTYIINNKYHRRYPYHLQVDSPTLMITEKILKFGMVSTEGFVTSVPVRIYNNYNVSINFQWSELTSDTPFDIIPISGTIPKYSCKICDAIYVSKPSKSKTYEVDFISQSTSTTLIPLEFNLFTRKVSVKFLQQVVTFKDIPLNLEVNERVRLENSSREFCVFHVIEPILPGIRIEPMDGTIRPKSVLIFEIIVKISCILEFAFDIYVKINNKENLILSINGNVVEPKIVIRPKIVSMCRIPCNMITFVPVILQNIGQAKSLIEVLGDECMFDVYIAQGNEKKRIYEFVVEGGQSKTVFIKVFDIFRREYDMFIPFKINRLLGPPNQDTASMELHYYIGEYEQVYENNLKVKIKNHNRDISHCRINGVITLPWIEFSENNFEIEYTPNGNNSINFTMTNISKYYLQVTILTSKLAPSFTLTQDLQTEENQSLKTETNIKFELDIGSKVQLTLTFSPKGYGKFTATAILYLDKHLSIPYYNLTFIGKRQTPLMVPSVYRIIFPPTRVGNIVSRLMTLKMEGQSELDLFTCSSREEPNLDIKMMSVELIQENDEWHTILTVEITVCCQTTYARNIVLNFANENGAVCEVEVSFCCTYCQLTLHMESIVKAEENPYPYYPNENQTELYKYMENCLKFLEKWMFQQGFRRDLYPSIPDTFHAISTAISTAASASPSTGKSKGINVSYLNFVRRIAGPLMKHIRKVSVSGIDESFRCVQEIHDTYREIINLLRTRGANLWALQARFLLSYNQFEIYTEYVAPKCNADIIITQELLSNKELFGRLSKQSWVDFILQSYKVFVLDSCFFECVCESSQPRDIVQILIDWYNEQSSAQHSSLRPKDTPVKVITNLTTDLSDGISLASSILNFCPFFKEHFSIFCEVKEENKKGQIVHNACLIIEALNLLRLYFPLSSSDLLQPNFLQMLFLSIHLYVTLPMFKPKDTVIFNPPLLRSSTRLVSVSTAPQESLLFNCLILYNINNSFFVEKAASGDNSKKIFLSVKYTANFIHDEKAILLVHGYNKTRIFDTYIVFHLHASLGALNPSRKCKVTGPLYRPIKVDVLVSSPFPVNSQFKVYITDVEPTIPVNFEESKRDFYVRRLNLIDKEINLSAQPQETGQDIVEHKLYMLLICLSSQIGNSWIWFRGEVGEFFIRVTTHPRCDVPLDILQVKVQSWPMDPCSCGESCECYRSAVLMIPHRNDLMVKSLRTALVENATDSMMQVFDRLIETTTGKIILGILFTEADTNMSDVNHILRNESRYRISSRTLLPRPDHATFAQHAAGVLHLVVTLPPSESSEKHTLTFTSDCGMDIRTYRIFFIKTSDSE